MKLHRSYKLVIVSLVAGIFLPLLLDSRVAGCIDYCGPFSRSGGSINLIIFLWSCILMYTARKKMRFGGSKLWIVLEVISFLFFALYFIDSVKSITELISFLKAESALQIAYRSGEIYEPLFYILIGIWTLVAYILVWCGDLASETMSAARRISKAISISMLFIITTVAIFWSAYFFTTQGGQSLTTLCKSAFIEIQNGFASTSNPLTCSNDDDCWASIKLERELVSKGYKTLVDKTSIYGLACGSFNYRCVTGKCVPGE